MFVLQTKSLWSILMMSSYLLSSLWTVTTSWPTLACSTCSWLRTSPWRLPCWSLARSTPTTGAASARRYWTVQLRPKLLRLPLNLWIWTRCHLCVRATTSARRTTSPSESGSGWAASPSPWFTAPSCWTCGGSPAGTWLSTLLTQTTAGPSTTSWCSPSRRVRRVSPKSFHNSLSFNKPSAATWRLLFISCDYELVSLCVCRCATLRGFYWFCSHVSA